MPKKILLTGGAKRVSGELARFLLSQNYVVYLQYYQSEDAVKKLQKEWNNSQFIPLYADFSTDSGIDQFIEKLKTNDIGFDVFIHSASIFVYDTIRNAKMENIAKSIRVHHNAAQMLINYASSNSFAFKTIIILDKMVERPAPFYYSYRIGKNALFELCKTYIQNRENNFKIYGIIPSLLMPPEGKDSQYFSKLIESNKSNELTPPPLLIKTIERVLRDDLESQFISLSEQEE